jgi:hypothetical protein
LSHPRCSNTLAPGGPGARQEEKLTEPSSRPPADPPGAQAAGTPRWVKILGVVVLLLVLLIVVLHLTGNSMGGPGSHLGSAPGSPPWR